MSAKNGSTNHIIANRKKDWARRSQFRKSISSGNDMLYNLHRKIYSTKEKTRIYRYRLELYVWNDQYSFL